MLIYAPSISKAVELTQLIFKVGVCDVEDFLLNLLGAAAGYFFIRKKTNC